MDLFDVFGYEHLNPPYTNVKQDQPFLESLRCAFDEYLELMKSLTEENESSHIINTRYDHIRHVTEQVLLVITNYLSGNPISAYATLSNLMTELTPDLIRLYKLSLTIAPRNKHFGKKLILYRLRRGDMHSLKRKDLFHLPFGLRHLLYPYRYSTPSVPCLYLGGSSYVCWEELGRPNFDEIQLSGFELKNDNLTLLDLSGTSMSLNNFRNYITSEDYKRMPNPHITSDTIESFYDLSVSYAICFPLLIACSYKTKYFSCVFHEEYILPQLVMQWIYLEKRFHCIRYMSTKVPNINTAHRLAQNYVFPVAKISDTGDFCNELSSSFDLSKPVSWQLALATSGGSLTEFKYLKKNNTSREFIMLDGVHLDYEGTIFSSVEDAISRRPFSSVDVEEL